MKTKEWFIGLIVAGLIASAAWIAFNPASMAAPDITFMSITGEKIKLKDWQGKPVIVTFWATDCPGCIKEIPHLIELYREYHERGLEIIAVAMYYDPPNHVVEMTRAKQLPYKVALDLQAEHAKAFGDVRLTPTTFLIKPDGMIALHKIGEFDLADMKKRIDSYLVPKLQLGSEKLHALHG